MYEYLADEGVDSVGFTLRTASLMSDAEPYFDDTNPGDYALFGVRYLLLPTTMNPPVPADLLLTSGPYALWLLPSVHYVQVVDTVGSIIENRTDIGARSSAFIGSSAPTEGRYLTVAYAGAEPSLPTLAASATPKGPAGTVLSEHADLAQGTITATVDARRTAVVLLSASYDPGWKVTVDGRPASTEIIVPAMPGVRVTAGRHVVRFTYVGYQSYWAVFLLSGLSVAVAGGVSARWRRRARSEREGTELDEPEGGGLDSDTQDVLPTQGAEEESGQTNEADHEQIGLDEGIPKPDEESAASLGEAEAEHGRVEELPVEPVPVRTEVEEPQTDPNEPAADGSAPDESIPAGLTESPSVRKGQKAHRRRRRGPS